MKIGNSRGLRLPKSLIEQAGLSGEVEVHAAPGRLVVEAVPQARVGWADAAKRMHAAGDDRLLDVATQTTFDGADWNW